ncbi:HNH endonuclease [Streptomyces sp. NBC_01352]|uniref:HNH endonuclease n=1 Tax=Streptomyces sp. NBC_01352 TaxID=2903834 RepID=UPI003FCC8C7D
MRPTRAATAAAVLCALAALFNPTTAHAADPGDMIALPVRDALAALPIQEESRAGYSRDKYRHWIDADRDGCSTRNEVLLEEAVTAPEQGANCTLRGGSWYSPYDDATFTQARALAIDHLVPLAESWDSGASAWTTQERTAYANDLDDARALIAVSATSSGVRVGSHSSS